MENFIFAVVLSLLMVHGMDAIRAKEWMMFLILKDMPEEIGYKVFTALHLILYIAAFCMLLYGGTASYTIKIIIDIFLVFHAILHYGFRKHLHSNGFKSLFSVGIIYSMAVLAVVHLVMIFCEV